MLRPVVQLNRWHRLYSSRPTFHNFIDSHFPVSIHHRTGTPCHHRSVHFRSRGLRFPNGSGESSESADTDNDSDKKSRNEKKREARRAVGWATDLAAFSPLQIKRILRYAFSTACPVSATHFTKHFHRVNNYFQLKQTTSTQSAKHYLLVWMQYNKHSH